MSKLQTKLRNRVLRKNRIRAIVSGTPERPRLSVYLSNQNVTAQLIDDTAHKTVAYITTVGQKVATDTMTAKATWVGSEIAKQAKNLKVTNVVFDRGGKLYHGRVKALADAARAEGLEF